MVRLEKDSYDKDTNFQSAPESGSGPETRAQDETPSSNEDIAHEGWWGQADRAATADRALGTKEDKAQAHGPST